MSRSRLYTRIQTDGVTSFSLSDITAFEHYYGSQNNGDHKSELVYLIQSKRTDIGLEEVFEVIRTSYNQENPDEFIQTYSSDKAIEWTYRAIIRDLEQSLISCHYDTPYIWDLLLPMKVYRGQMTSKQELLAWELNVGSIITMSSFLSTKTFDNEDNDNERTVFTIYANKTIAPKAVYAYLYHIDYEPDDQEILFSLRTLFHIDKVLYFKLEETCESLIYVRDLSTDNGAFLSFQLSLDIILRSNRNDSARQEMLSLGRTKFYHEPLTLMKIQQFELMYTSEQDAARWYTSDSFLYRLLNEVLRYL
ncbi:hypothetical protein I4U23_019872 [Adineta vaga]|nr:hypothetical protein I4U23_019872 [Adineta vaga]